MTKPQVKEHNQETGEIILRDMTDEEFTAYQEFQADAEFKIEKVKSDAIAKQALLDKLGITAEEAILLLGGN